MIVIYDLHLAPGERETRLKKLAAKVLRTDESSIVSLRIIKKSLDARKKGNIHYTYTVEVAISGNEAQLLQRSGKAKTAPAKASYLHDPTGSPDR